MGENAGSMGHFYSAITLNVPQRHGVPGLNIEGKAGLFCQFWIACSGVAWHDRSKGDHPKDSIQMLLNDPSFAVPVNAAV
jgi:hypothetical protein